MIAKESEIPAAETTKALRAIILRDSSNLEACLACCKFLHIEAQRLHHHEFLNIQGLESASKLVSIVFFLRIADVKNDSANGFVVRALRLFDLRGGASTIRV